MYFVLVCWIIISEQYLNSILGDCHSPSSNDKTILDVDIWGCGCIKATFPLLLVHNLSCNMWLPTLWHFEKCRLRWACAASFKLRNSKCCSLNSLPVRNIQVTSKGSDQSAHMRRLVGGSAGLHVPHCWKSHVTTHLLLLSFHGCLSFSSFCDLSGFAVTALKGGGGWLLFPFYLVLVWSGDNWNRIV